MSAVAVASVFSDRGSPAFAADELPPTLRDYTKLAPLGPKSIGTGNSNGNSEKSKGVSPEEMARRLTVDLVKGAHGRGGYFLTGDLSVDLFRDDCVFEDPTNRVDSLSQYQKALTLLFDPDRSTVELLGDGLSVNVVGEGGETATTITGRLRSRGYLRVAPWKPYVKAYETTITYTLDPATGLVARQDQKWTKDASEALKETFTPSWNGSPPNSLLEKKDTEPEAVTALFDVLNGRRPGEYSLEERSEIDARIEKVVQLATSKASSSSSGAATPMPGLAGTWVLVYLQPGPDGAGIDRRIPFFPEFDFNDSFQVFSASESGAAGASSSASTNRVTNVGQILGSLADVEVSGSLREVLPTSSEAVTEKIIRRFEATIEGGRLCFGSSAFRPTATKATIEETATGTCPIDLPMIKGKGIFDSLYLGNRLRIGQNINGGGARVVQLRL